MNKATILTCTLLLLSLALSSAYQATNASYTIVPSQILNSTDTNFQQNSTASIFITRASNDTQITLWGLSGNSNSPRAYSLYRRYLDSTSFARVGSDAKINLVLQSDLKPVATYSDNGYVAIVTRNNVATNNYDLYLTTFLATITDASTASTVQVSNSPNSSISYQIGQIWSQDGYFYVLYYQIGSSGNPTQLFLQGYQITNPKTLKFTSAILLSSTTLSGDVTDVNATCGQVPGAQNIFCMWRQNSQKKLVYTSVDISKSAPGVTETTLLTDDSSNTYYPNRVVPGTDYYVILVDKVSSGLTTGFSFQISSSASISASLANLPITLPTDYTSTKIDASSSYYDGWFLVTRETKGLSIITDNSQVAVQQFNKQGNLNSSATLLTDGSIIQTLTLSNQSYYALISDSPSARSTGNAYLGQIYNKIGTKSGLTLSVLPVALLSFVIAIFLL